jgi:signal transduction histidine kinase
VYSQTASLDSLTIRLQQSTQDTAQVLFLCDLSTKFLTYRPPLSRQYALEALQLSQKLKYKRGEMLALNKIGEYEFRQSNYARAVEHLTRSLRHAEELHDSLAMAGVYRVLGNINTFGFKQYDKALKYQLLALSIYETRKDMRNIASLYGNVTWIYAITHQNLEEAHRLSRRGAQIADSLGIDQLLSYNYNSQGLIFMNEGELDSALFYLDKSNEIGILVMDRSLNSYNNSIKGNIFLIKKDFKNARDLFSLAEHESRLLNSREVLKDCYYGLSQAYEGLGNYSLAYQYHKQFTELKDSLVNWETTQRALMMEYELDEQRREVRIAKLEQSALQATREKKIYTILILVGFTSLLIIIMLIVRNNRERAISNEILLEKNKAIENQNLELKQANEIKDKLFFIIGHDLRGPLSSLKSILALVARNEVSEAEFKMFAPQLNQHVVGVSETIENLLQWSGSQLHGWQQQPIYFAIQKVIDKSCQLFAEAAQRKNIILINNVGSELQVYADQNQIELVFRNLIHNAIKFTPDGGQITVSASASQEFVEIDIQDTGVGMTEKQLASLFEEASIRNTRGTKGERGTGLGLTLCNEMIRTNGGHITVTSKENEGTTVRVFIPIGKLVRT